MLFVPFSSHPHTLSAHLNFCQRVENIPREYGQLRELTLDLASELATSIEAGKIFRTEVVRKAINRLIELVIDATLEISRSYSNSKTSE